MNEVANNSRDALTKQPVDFAGIPLWVVLTCSVAIGLFAMEVTRSLLFPWFTFNAPWQGLHIVAAARILEGKTLYTDVLREASFYAYPALLPWIHALFLKVFGVGVFAVKLSAVLSCVATLVGVYYLSDLLTGNKIAGLLGVAFYISFFEVLHFWHISVRPDNMASSFVLWATIVGYRYREAQGIWSMVVVGALLAAAVLCKQTFVLMAISYLAYLLWAGYVRSAVTTSFVLIAVGAIFLVAYNTGQESFWDTITIFSRHPLRTPWEIVTKVQWILLLTLVPLAITIAKVKTLGLLAWQVLGAFAMGVVGIAKWGGDVNTFLPLVVLLSPVMVSGLTLSVGNVQAKLFYSIFVGLVVIVFAIQSLDRVINWRMYYMDNLTDVSRFVEENSDKAIYFPINNYVTYLGAGQYYHCEWMTENLVVAGFSIPEALANQVVNRDFDYILGDFRTPQMSALVRRSYRRTAIPGLPVESVWVPK